MCVCVRVCPLVYSVCFTTAVVATSHHKLGHFVCGQVQGEVLVGALDGEGRGVGADAGALLRQALVARGNGVQLLGAAERVAVGGVLAQVGPLGDAPLVQPHVIQRLAVAVSGALPLLANHRLTDKKGETEGGERKEVR